MEFKKKSKIKSHIFLDGIEHKFCIKCTSVKILSLFPKDKSRWDGLFSYCKPCAVVNSQKLYWKKPEEKKAYGRSQHQKTKRYANDKQLEKIRSTPALKIAKNLRNRLSKIIKRNKMSVSAVRDLGCTIFEFKIYLESKFQTGMSWDNYGLYGWHIDHIKPLTKFDLTDPIQCKQACHYTNLQPLWAIDNIRKRNHYVEIEEVSLGN